MITTARERMIERESERSRANELARLRKEQAENAYQVEYFARFGIAGDIVRRPELERPLLELDVLTEAVHLSHYRDREYNEKVDVRGSASSFTLVRDGEGDQEWGDMILDAIGKSAGL